MYSTEEVLERVKRIENVILQYKEGAVWASEMANAIAVQVMEILENTELSPLVEDESNNLHQG